MSWGLGADPIPDLVELLEERGVKVLPMALRDVSGLTAQVRWASNGCILSAIVVNAADSGERQRFTVARELGRLVLDVAPEAEGAKSARCFARALLMPADMLRAEIGKRRGRGESPSKEPRRIAPGLPRRFKRLCWRALSEGAISESRAAELLGVSVHDLERETTGPPDADRDDGRGAEASDPRPPDRVPSRAATDAFRS